MKSHSINLRILKKFKIQNTQSHLFKNMAGFVFKFKITRKGNFTNEDLNLRVKYLPRLHMSEVFASQGSKLARIANFDNRV